MTKKKKKCSEANESCDNAWGTVKLTIEKMRMKDNGTTSLDKNFFAGKAATKLSEQFQDWIDRSNVAAIASKHEHARLMKSERKYFLE